MSKRAKRYIQKTNKLETLPPDDLEILVAQVNVFGADRELLRHFDTLICGETYLAIDDLPDIVILRFWA